jgi:hypothetical protein
VPRPLLELWHELNRNRDREPSSFLLKELAELTPPGGMAKAIRAAITPRPLGAIDEMIRAEGRRIEQEKLQNPIRAMMRQFEREMEVAERLMGRKRPVSPALPEKAPSACQTQARRPPL